MPQLSLYLDDPTMDMLRRNSEHAHLTLSKYVVRLIRQDDAEKGWPEGYWDEVYGSLDDSSFVAPEEVDVPLDEPALV